MLARLPIRMKRRQLPKLWVYPSPNYSRISARPFYMNRAYVHGYDGLAEYLGGISPKAARALDARINFPKCPLPGVVRDVVLFRLSEVDATIDRIRRERAAASEAALQADKDAKGWKRPGVRDMNVKAFADSFEQSEGRKR